MKLRTATIVTAALAAFLACLGAQARITAKPIDYEHDGQKLEGYLVWDDAKSGPRPGVLVVHEWWGLNDYTKNRARQLAEMGYIAFAADMFGKGKVTRDAKQAQAWYTEATSKPGLLASRSKAALEVLKKQPGVDPKRLAAIGFCFGGSTVLELAYSGEPINAVVAFHPGVVVPDEKQSKAIKTSILVLYGAEDKFSKPEDLAKLQTVLDQAKVDWYLVTYAQAMHAFTNPQADSFKIPGIGYNKKAAERSWDEMGRFFQTALK